MADLGNCRHTGQSQQDGQAEKDNGIQSDPNSVHVVLFLEIEGFDNDSEAVTIL
jgi:hypothetical protein